MAKSRKKKVPTVGMPLLDVHAEEIARSVSAAAATIAALDPERQVAELDDKIRAAIGTLTDLIRGHDPIEIVEQARLKGLPWQSGQAVYQAGVENGFSCVELVAIVAIKCGPKDSVPVSAPAETIGRCLEIAAELLELGIIRAVIAADPTDPLAPIAASLQATEMMVRASSYPELVEITTRSLFGESTVEASLRESVGFGVSEAFEVLASLHALQVANMNRRQEAGFRAAQEAGQRHALGVATQDEFRKVEQLFRRTREPNSVDASVSVADLVGATRLSEGIVTAVLDAFTWHPGEARGAEEEVRAFLAGDNALRAFPVIRTSSSRALLVHPALTQSAVRERLESILRASPHWEKYQRHRGTMLEDRTRQAFEKLLGPTRAWHAFHYYVPASEAERQLVPMQYSKRVEGDHLIVIDDVAIVIEDKAVALSAQSRTGAGFRLQKDLTGIITKAAEQADRLVQRIQADGGVRVHGEGWVDLSHVREIHTVAVSLEDLSSTSTATAELVRAEIIATESVPWTVSIHDLDLIAELTSHPAEFLLYLRRRRHPLATVLYTAPDELDLFLFFFESGLYVEDDPGAVRAKFTFLPAATHAELARWRQQTPGVVTSRTDPLDAWFFEDFLQARAGRSRRPTAPPKPHRAASPLEALLSSINTLGAFASTSIQATLLSGDKRTQQRMARFGKDIARGSNNGMLERTITVPVATLEDGGWLLVWATCPSAQDRQEWERRMRGYLRAKGHQLQLSRAALFAFDGASEELFATLFEAIPDELTDSERAIAEALTPASEMGSLRQVPKAMRSTRTQPRRKNRRR